MGAVDDDVSRWFADERTPTLTDVADAGTLLGETIVGVIGLVVVGVIFSVWQRSWLPLVFVLLVDAGIGAIYWLGTTLDPRDRPPVKILDPGLVPDPASRPATSAPPPRCSACRSCSCGSTRGPPGGGRSRCCCSRWCACSSRLYEGAHHLTDVLTSMAYTCLWIAAVASLVLLRDRPTS